MLDWLQNQGHTSPEKIVERENWSTKKRGEFSNKVVDEMEEKGEIKALYRDFKFNLEAAREYKVCYSGCFTGCRLTAATSLKDTRADEGPKCGMTAMVFWNDTHDHGLGLEHGMDWPKWNSLLGDLEIRKWGMWTLCIWR